MLRKYETYTSFVYLWNIPNMCYLSLPKLSWSFCVPTCLKYVAGIQFRIIWLEEELFLSESKGISKLSHSVFHFLFKADGRPPRPGVCSEVSANSTAMLLSNISFSRTFPSSLPVLMYLALTCNHIFFFQTIPSFIHLPPYPSLYRLSQHHTPPSVHFVYLHGNSVFNKHRSQLSVQLKEDLSLTSLVQVTQCQRLDMESLPSL